KELINITTSLPGSPPVPANLKNLIGASDRDMRNENAVQGFSFGGDRSHNGPGAKISHRHVADHDVFQESSGTPGRSSVILRAGSRVDCDRVVGNSPYNV